MLECQSVSLSYDGLRDAVTQLDFTVAAGRTPTHPVAVAEHDPYQVELRRFVDCIQGRADPALLDVDQAIEALVLSLATQRSLAEQRSIDSFTSA